MSDSSAAKDCGHVSRRDFLATTGTGIAALAAAGCAPAEQDGVKADETGTGTGGSAAGKMLDNVPRAPFDTFRDWIGALEAHGLLMRFERMDQDAYHTTGLFFRATDKFGMYETPAMRFDNVKIDGEWIKGPVIANHQGHWNADALIWGIDPVPGDHYATRQLPGEGGRAEFPELNRVLLEKGAPNVFAEVDALYGQVLRDFRRV